MSMHHQTTVDCPLLGKVNVCFISSGSYTNLDVQIVEAWIDVVETGAVVALNAALTRAAYSRPVQVDIDKRLWPALRLGAWDELTDQAQRDRDPSLNDERMLVAGGVTAMIRIALPPLSTEHRIQALRLLETGRNPRTGKPISPEMRDALRAMRPAVRSNVARLEGRTMTAVATRAEQALAEMERAAANERAVIGGNNPPEPTPFEQSRNQIEDLFMEAKNWLDGDPIASQAAADEVGGLMDKLRQAEKLADERRKAEAKPFDDGKAEVQARYNPLCQPGKGKAALAIQACKDALKPFLAAEDAKKRAAAETARREADVARKVAEEALRSSQAADLTRREEAGRLLREAKVAERAAATAETSKAQVAGGARAIGARSRWVAALTDRREAMRFLWGECPEQFDAVLLRVGQDYVTAGRRAIPGFTITEQTSVQ